MGKKRQAAALTFAEIAPEQKLAVLRHSREMTLLCSPKVTHHHTGKVALLPPGNRTPPPLGPPVKTNWLGKSEWVTGNKKHGGGACSFLPAGKHGQIVFFVWVDLSEHKWIILAERRGV